MAYCGHCGAELFEGDAFCRRCGTAVPDVLPAENSPADSSTRRRARTALIVAAIVLGLLVLGGVVYLVAFLPVTSRITEVTQPGSGASSSSEGTRSGVATVAGGGTSGTVTPPAPTSSTGENPVAPAKPKSPSTANDVTHQATFVTRTGVANGGANTITFDYVQFLTGPAAQTAATAHGDTVENDYYVVNDNPRLRTFPIASAAVIRLHPANGPSYSRIFSFPEFKALVLDGSAIYGGQNYTWSPETTYYVTVKNGKVTRVEHQWVP